ncbi:PREDICTED: leucine-rich repeat-containing protein 71 [Nanorana parkeri]|uniref:leucine-rich repeat-containing protein 71 n=1 Tax=Nanorana parkeri TaxID=125878 RepID=UPI0008544F80|nr:PREDICTED: leucine-rich repeat-containing protein 71 [Nanorana parkeri]
MGKKTEKLLKEKALKESENDPQSAGVGPQDKTLLSADDYQCTGNLEQDFTELCSRLGYTECPRVVNRPRLASTPASEKTTFDDTADWTSEIDSQIAHIKERFSYFKPSIQIEVDNEDGRSVREIAIRGWKIDDKMMGIFSKCLPALTSLHKISLWNVGLTDDTFTSLFTILQRCPSIRVFALEGNPLPQQSYYKLISDDLAFSHISLRNNKINDEGARLISQALQSLKMTSKNLASLVLSYNHITDKGASDIAQALRFNRSLLSLNLSSNQIDDEGALALAEVLGHFSLAHAEIVERRRLLLEKAAQEQPKSPTTSRHADSKSDRPPSHHSSSTMEKADKADKAQKSKQSITKKKEKDTQKKEEKSASNMTSGTSTSTSQAGGSNKKDDLKTSKKQLANPEQKNTRGEPVKSATRRAALPEQEQTEPAEVTNLLLEQAEFRDGKVFLPGNKVLISLNISRNKISEFGLKGFLAAVETQVAETKPIPGTRSHTGLLRLAVGNNNFPADCPTLIRLQEILLPRDPIQKPFKASEEEQPM